MIEEDICIIKKVDGYEYEQWKYSELISDRLSFVCDTDEQKIQLLSKMLGNLMSELRLTPNTILKITEQDSQFEAVDYHTWYKEGN